MNFYPERLIWNKMENSNLKCVYVCVYVCVCVLKCMLMFELEKKAYLKRFPEHDFF